MSLRNEWKKRATEHETAQCAAREKEIMTFFTSVMSKPFADTVAYVSDNWGIEPQDVKDMAKRWIDSQ